MGTRENFVVTKTQSKINIHRGFLYYPVFSGATVPTFKFPVGSTEGLPGGRHRFPLSRKGSEWHAHSPATTGERLVADGTGCSALQHMQSRAKETRPVRDYHVPIPSSLTALLKLYWKLNSGLNEASRDL